MQARRAGRAAGPLSPVSASRRERWFRPALEEMRWPLSLQRLIEHGLGCGSREQRRVPAFDLRPATVWTRQVEPAMRFAAERKVGHRESIAAEICAIREVPI